MRLLHLTVTNGRRISLPSTASGMAIVPPMTAHAVSPDSPPGINIVQNLVGAADALRKAIRVC